MTEKTGLDLLRVPFADNQISKLPKPTKKQTEDVKADYKKGKRCTICGAWHHPDVVHLDYVGHAALTHRLLDCDINWSWEPLAVGADGYPVIDRDGGMWIKLTVCGTTRLGYGDAQGKTGGDAMKERIGDALRNAAMRFGAALDLWHKGDQPLGDDSSHDAKQNTANDEANQLWDNALNAVKTAADMQALQKHFVAAQSLMTNDVEKNQLILAKYVRKEQISAMIAQQGITQ